MFDIIYSLNKLIIILINFFKSIKEFNYKLIYTHPYGRFKKMVLKKTLSDTNLFNRCHGRISIQ